MADGRVSTPTGSRNTARRHFRTASQFRSSSQSPAPHPQRLSDDLLSQLSPNGAVDALRSPTGALKICMDRASTSEQAFAMKAAIASKKIRDWLDELSDWPWPAHSGSSGFGMPPIKRRKLAESESSADDLKGKLAESYFTSDTNYLGSLPAADVEHYEKRVEQIHQDLDNLGLEEIKNQVLHNHILPLSRPSSPFSDGGRSTSSAFMYAKMEDLTAVVTAITVQALPNLSRLSRLLKTWTVRLLILRKVPSLLKMISDAEVALCSGWSATGSASANPASSNGYEGDIQDKPSGLSRKEFDVMKGIIQQKVTKPGRAIDYMLDSLEESTDTLPDEWLDRMEAVERNYVEWETIAERKVRDGESSNLLQHTQEHVSRVEPETPRPKIQIQGPSPDKVLADLPGGTQFASPPTPFDDSPVQTKAAREQYTPSHKPSKGVNPSSSRRAAVEILADDPSRDISGSTPQVIDLTTHIAHQSETDSGTTVQNPSLTHDGANEKRPARPATAASKLTRPLADSSRLPPPQKSGSRTYDGSEDTEATDRNQISPVLGEVDRNVVRNPPQELKKPQIIHQRESALVDDPEPSVLEPSLLEPVDEEGEELDLPPARLGPRKDSRESIASTVIHGPPGSFLDRSDGAPFREESMEPDLPRLPDPDEPFSSDAVSPPSSPPLRFQARSTSVTFKDIPEIAPLPAPSSSTPPRSPFEQSEVFDADVSYESESLLGSPSRMSTISSTSEDEHLQQQLSELLESIPARIRLQRTPGINLNPPDFQLPSRPRGRTSDTTRRSNSSLSSRAGTPSFMLAPARDHRPRSKSQGIRVYHLSRSTGEPPIKLFIRCVGEGGERVMVRVGGGWADLGEYLREYAVHHSRRSKGEGKVDVKDVPAMAANTVGSSPTSRPGSAMDTPVTPLAIRKTRKSLGEEGAPKFPKTPFSGTTTKQDSDTPSSETSARSRASSRVDWDEEDSALGLAGPKGKKVDISEESRAWVESVKEKVRVASGERVAPAEQRPDTKFGEMGRVGGTKRLFRRN
ncbi:hypothetical protein AAE478_004245 [Parahypoxylon ruwenzoriense]